MAKLSGLKSPLSNYGLDVVALEIIGWGDHRMYIIKKIKNKKKTIGE